MTIGIITYHLSTNYGAVLQAYALQKVLANMGYSSEIIDYNNPKKALSSLSRYRRIQHFIWHKVVKKMLVGTKRQKRTDEFRQKYLQISTKKYFDSKTLQSDPPYYDAYITGSDQVWNPKIHNNDSSYFLTFAPKGKRRISYAASFGVSKIPDRFVDDYTKWLNQFNYLSTREIEGQQIIKKLTGRQAEITLDPTLLLEQEEWNQIAEPYKSSRSYILCYYMPGDTLVNESITRLAQQVSSFTGWKIINIGQKEYIRLNPLINSIFDAGPAQFLGLFQNASFVVTNSFHGTAFSIIYRKPFYTLVNNKLPPEKALSSRISTLLNTLKLQERMISAEEKIPQNNVVEVDYSIAEIILGQERQNSINFLKNALWEDK